MKFGGGLFEGGGAEVAAELLEAFFAEGGEFGVEFYFGGVSIVWGGVLFEELGEEDHGAGDAGGGEVGAAGIFEVGAALGEMLGEFDGDFF